VFNVFEILILEIAQRAQHRVRRAHAQAAKAGVLDHVAEIDQQVESTWVASPSQILVRRLNIWAVPVRQGMHLPQDSVMQNSMKNRATLTMHEVSSITIIPPDPIIDPAPISDS